MTNKRQTNRDRARIRRAVDKAMAGEELRSKRKRLLDILGRVNAIIIDNHFCELAMSHKITTVPECLLIPHCTTTQETAAQLVDDKDFSEAVLNFVLAWKFLHPLLSLPEFKEYLDNVWPGFISDFKDVFIWLVMIGPFPSERRVAISSVQYRKF